MRRVSKRGQQNMRSNYHDPNDRPISNVPDSFRNNAPPCVRCRTTRDTLDASNQSHGFGPWRLGARGNCGPCCGGSDAGGPRECYPGVNGGVPIGKKEVGGANARQRFGKIMNVPNRNIQVQTVGERSGLGPCTTMCRSRSYTDGVPGPWSGAYPAAKQCKDCCGGAYASPGARVDLNPNAKKVCKSGTFNTSIEMARGSRGVSNMDKERRCTPGSTDRDCGFRCSCEDGRELLCGYYPGRTCVECCAGKIFPDKKTQGGMNFRGGGFPFSAQRDTFFRAQGQNDCTPPQVMVNGVCTDLGLGGDPTRVKKPPFPFKPTTGPFDPMGAKQGACPPGTEDVNGECVPITLPNPGGKKKRQCNTTADCPPKHLCQLGSGRCVEFFYPGELCPNGRVANNQGFMEDVCVLPSSNNDVRPNQVLRRRRR